MKLVTSNGNIGTPEVLNTPDGIKFGVNWEEPSTELETDETQALLTMILECFVATPQESPLERP